MTIKKVKENIGFHYLLIKIQLYTLIKCIAFIEYMVAGKDLLDYTYLFSPNNYTNNCNIIYKYLRPNMANLEFRLKTIDETRTCRLE